MIDQAHHHLAHVDEVLSAHLVVVHDGPLDLAIDLIGKVLSLFAERLHLLSCVRQDVLESLGRVPLDLLSSDLVLSVNPPSQDVLLLEELLFLLQKLLIPCLKLGLGLFLQRLSLS